jgi:hypothetical protein
MDEDTAAGGQIGRIALIVGAGLCAMFGAGIALGLVAGHLEKGGPIRPLLLAAGLAAVLLTAGSAYLGYRTMRTMARVSGPGASRDRRNRTVLIICGAMGGAIGMALSLGGSSPLTAFSNEPLPAWLAIVLTVPIAVILPILSLYWHRSVADEQEAAAYNKGALIGIYTYFIGAPTWWLLWRGGLVPAPDGILIYLITMAVTGTIWLWAKYR